MLDFKPDEEFGNNKVYKVGTTIRPKASETPIARYNSQQTLSYNHCCSGFHIHKFSVMNEIVDQ